MGKLIQCSSELAKHPYCFPMTRTNVYSMEEVCYYIRNNIYMMQEEVFDSAFVCWIRDELKMEETARKLEQMRKDKDNLKDMVVTLCCSCDYYTEKQINDLIAIMDATHDMSLWERQKVKADSYLKSGNLEKARREYEHILEFREVLQDPNGIGAKIYYNLGVCYAGLGEFMQAASGFKKSFELGQQQRAKEGYLYSLKLADAVDAYDAAVQEMGLAKDEIVFLESQYRQVREQSQDTRRYHQIKRLERLLEKGDTEEYRIQCRDVLNHWKEEYRQQMQS